MNEQNEQQIELQRQISNYADHLINNTIEYKKLRDNAKTSVSRRYYTKKMQKNNRELGSLIDTTAEISKFFNQHYLEPTE